MNTSTPKPSAKEVFLGAIEISSAEERRAYLDRQCGEDQALHQEVETLLSSHATAGEFLAAPADPDLAASLDAPTFFIAPGTMVGRYKLLEPIGEGGYGTVFMAEQTSPVQRRVALKIIKAGMDTRQVIARFEAERQALALMDHPNIAKVFDAGVTDTGRPYFVMELVKGVALTKYCDEHHVEPRQRLELFMQVCQAVQHAHTKGIIHRDLKPSNVLVALYDGKPVPKVIDFGVAKATGQKLTDRTMFTGFGDVIGTLEYMSPEQAEVNQLDIDTRSDIYSLGVLLYELLTGSTPLEHKRVLKAGLLEMLRVVREEEPQKPSTRLITSEQLPSIAANRGLEPKKLSGLVHGELDWIVLKALEKDRNRRYETANGFAKDIERYLEDEAVQACPPSARYRFRKFARRHKGALVTASLAAAALLVLVAGLAVSNRLIAAERNQTAQALTLAEAQSKRAQTNFWRASIAIRELMTKTALGEDNVPPAVRKRFSEEAIKYYQSLLQDSSPDPTLRYETAVGYLSLAGVHASWDDVELAENCYRQSITILDALVADHPAVQDYRQRLGYAHVTFGRMLREMGRLEESRNVLKRGEQIYEQLLIETPDSYDYAFELALLLRHLTGLHLAAHRPEELKKSQARAVELLTMLLEGRSGPNPYPARHSKAVLCESIGHMHRYLGLSERAVRHHDETEAAFQAAVAMFEKAISEDPSNPAYWHYLADSHRSIGLAHRERNRLDEAEQELRRGIDLHQQCMAKFPNELKLLTSLERTHCYGDLYRLLIKAGRQQDAKALLNGIKVEPKDAQLRAFRAGVFLECGEFQQAVAEYSEVLALAPQLPDAWTGRGFAYFHLKQWEPAIADFSKAIELGPQVHTNWFHRGHGYMNLAQWDKAAADFRKVTEIAPSHADSWYQRALVHAQLRKPAEACTYLRQAVAEDSRYAEWMKTQPRLEPIRASEEFKELLAELDEKKK